MTVIAEPKLITVIIHGENAAAAAASTYRHSVSAGEYIFEYALLEPDQTEEVPTWVAFTFVPTYTERAQKVIWLGYGFAQDDRFPLIIRGPIPLTGPGYFLAEAISVTLNDAIEGTFSYRKVKTQ